MKSRVHRRGKDLHSETVSGVAATAQCLRCMCGVMLLDQVRNEEVQRRTSVTRELAG